MASERVGTVSDMIGAVYRLQQVRELLAPYASWITSTKEQAEHNFVPSRAAVILRQGRTS